MANKPVMLVIMDGWGIREMEDGNAPYLGNTPNVDRWMRTYERAIVHTSGENVGLVPDQMGNSEVGHLNLGAGRVVYQDISRIDNAIREGTLGSLSAIVEAMEKAKNSASNVHLIGLLGPGGVHSHERHLFALLDIAKAAEVNPIVHVITDGRDTPTTSGIDFLENLTSKIRLDDNGRIASVSGRYYAMDRDKRWERTKLYYDALVKRTGNYASNAREAIEQSYNEGVSDEFILPTVIGDNDHLRVKSGDILIFYNFRADRVRQISSMFGVKGTGELPEDEFVDDLMLITMTQYTNELPAHVLFPMEVLHNVLAEVISNAGLTQYHSAETEKYPHVTYFFNGRREVPFNGEDRQIIPSPKVATYDLQPEMSAPELTAATLERMQTHDDDFILINFANPDMVGHTGSLEAAIKAVECVDECVGKLVERVLEKGGTAIVTADHGNCERMVDLVTGEAHTYHTIGPVSLFVIGDAYYELFTYGKLADVAPTALDLMGLNKPIEMTGRSLIKAQK